MTPPGGSGGSANIMDLLGGMAGAPQPAAAPVCVRTCVCVCVCMSVCLSSTAAKSVAVCLLLELYLLLSDPHVRNTLTGPHIRYSAHAHCVHNQAGRRLPSAEVLR